MMSVCPKCKRYTLEYEPRQHIRKCFTYDCGWIDRIDITYTARQSDVPKYKMSERLANELPFPSL